MTSVPSPAPPLQRSGLAKDASLVALETRAEAAERRARDAELRVVQLQEKATFLGEKADTAEAALKEQSSKLSRGGAAVLGDLQAKLPILIRAVVDSVSVPPWHPSSAPGSTFHRHPIKLELEDTSLVTNDPYYALLDRQSLGMAQAVTPREAAKEPQNQPEKTPPVGGQGGFMQRAMGAIAGSQRRNLKN
eukprot:CAMPEP_0115314152 /NCGR_PEP_ID=MMETSP0270-20121206/76875_1 /TAXON_ID=71861 /ORGANISM="Scrippsiella trochoidea, Strain CCMP3099" /LENGTH=190 /DNA_ID=CAMNT_0002733349 /DNA_START=15 /DNA_END=588 /DNA_ORIENTATION=+